MANTYDEISEAARLSAIIQSSGDAIISKDLNGVITSWNTGAEDLFGYSADEVIGKPIGFLIPDDRADEEPDVLDRIRRGEAVEPYETIRQRKDGSLIDISLAVSPILDAGGNIIGASNIARDVSQRKNNEAEMAKLAAIVESSSDAIISKDLNGIIMSWNKGAEQIFGYKPDEVIGKSITILMPPDRVNEEPGILERIRRGEKVDHYETIRQAKDGTLLNISLNISPVYDAHGKIIAASKIARDITEHRRAETAIRESETMRRLIDAQEGERHRIARDLHDHLGQRMTALRFRIESLMEKSHDPELLRSAVDEMRQFASDIDRDIGFLAWELRPTELSTLGLEDALRSFVREWSSIYLIDADFRVNSIDDTAARYLPDEIQTNAYRIVQEALNNILKHAQAHKVVVLMIRRKGQMVLIVEDDGVGFDEMSLEGRSKRQGLGLTSMRERALLLRGTLEIESKPGEGTTVIATIPIPEDAATEPVFRESQDPDPVPTRFESSTMIPMLLSCVDDLHDASHGLSVTDVQAGDSDGKLESSSAAAAGV